MSKPETSYRIRFSAKQWNSLRALYPGSETLDDKEFADFLVLKHKIMFAELNRSKLDQEASPGQPLENSQTSIEKQPEFEPEPPSLITEISLEDDDRDPNINPITGQPHDFD